MARVINQLIALQGRAEPVDIRKLVGPRNQTTHVWAMSDGATIVLTGTIRPHRRGKSPNVFDTVERLDKPYRVVAATIKRKYTLSRKKEEAKT